jgi:hypothetical protein
MVDKEKDIAQIAIRCDVPKEQSKEPVDIVIVSYASEHFSEALCRYADKDNYSTTCVLTKRDCGYSSFNKNH